MIENEFEWLPLSLVEKFIPLMERYNVSEVARGAKPSAQTREGFIEAYDAVDGLKSKMRKRETGFSDQTWDERRHAFVSRHMAQIEKRGEPLYQDNGDPTRHHLSLIAWAYSPDEGGIKEYAKEYRLNPKKKKKRKIPKRYTSAYKGKAKKEREKELRERSKEYDKAKGKKLTKAEKDKLYRPFKTDKGIKTKESPYTREAKRRGFVGSIKEKRLAAQKYYGRNKIPIEALEEVFDRGMDAWLKGGHRGGASQHAWAVARVNSFLVGGKTFFTADRDIAEEYLSKNLIKKIEKERVFKGKKNPADLKNGQQNVDEIMRNNPHHFSEKDKEIIEHFYYYFKNPNKKINVAIHHLNKNGVGEKIGSVVMSDSNNGLILAPNISGLPYGFHGFHIHEYPDLMPSMKDGKIVVGGKAGQHFDPYETDSHQGPYGHGHLGDLPRLYVNEDGNAIEAVVAPRLKLKDVEGLALIIHSGGDNYTDDPPNGGGASRIAGGIIENACRYCKRKNGYKAAIKGPIALEEDGQLSLLYRNPKKGSKLVVQAILIDKSLYDIEEAIEWIESSDFDLKKIDLGSESSQYFRFRQRDPDKMKKSSFRTKELTDGIKAIFAVPKN
jgi:Cu-Zn family superoxide dismutase